MLSLRISFIWILLLFSQPGAANIINICIDTAYWYPFTYAENGKAKGIHVEMVKAAAQALNKTVRFVPLPWKRCLLENKTGHIDAVVSASYKPDRADFLFFPEGAESESKSEYRIMQVEYNLVTLEDQKIEFRGDLTIVPEPVRVPLGYSIAQEMKDKGLWVDDSALNDQSNIKKLVRDRVGSVIIIPELAKHLNEFQSKVNKLRISAKPIRSKSYYVAFSKNTHLSKEERLEFWEQIKLIRKDENIMLKLNESYRQ